MNKVVWLKWLLVISIVGAAGCTSVNSKVGSTFGLDSDLRMEILVDENVNPDEQQQPSPVFVRFYELKATNAFESADFIDLYERDEEVLGDTFIAKQELKRLVPSTLVEQDFVLDKETRFVALFAEFYHYENAQAKVFFEVTGSNLIDDSIGVKLSGNRIRLVDIKHEKETGKRRSNSYSIKKDN